MGNILTMAKSDAKRILESLGFETEITIRKDTIQATIKGLGLVHHLSFDTEGQAVNSRTAHITICEKSLTDLNFPVRNLEGEVSLRKCVVSFVDSTNLLKTYTVKENFADETLGVITLQLGKYVE